MKGKSKLFAAIALAAVATSASAVTEIGNPGQKGSLLIYPRVDIATGDTLVTMVNDYAAGVIRVKCYYQASDPVTTPYTGTLAGLRPLKHKRDFEIELTHNQPISWLASSGRGIDGALVAPGLLLPFPDGAQRNAAELKCWAVTPDGSTERVHNHLFGTASVMNFTTGQAYEYTAYAFQARGNQSDALGSPGVLNLDNSEYDSCPAIVVGDFIPVGAPSPFGSATQVTLASCTQDLRQAYTPTITKLTYTFWNADEVPMTGAHQCADSWYETTFPQTGPANLNNAGFAALGTFSAYFRIVPTADSQWCANSTTPGFVGIKAESADNGLFLRGTNLTGRASRAGVIQYDTSIPDSFKQ
jgi:hypothetical protein